MPHLSKTAKNIEKMKMMQLHYITYSCIERKRKK